MRKLRLLPLYLLIVLLVAACGGDEEASSVEPETGLIGSWQLTAGEYTFDGKNIRDFIKQYAEARGAQLTDENLDEIETTFRDNTASLFNNGTVFNFQEDNKLIISEPNTSSQSVWNVANGVLTVSDSAEIVEYDIVKLTKAELRLLEEETVSFDPGLGSVNTLLGVTLIFAKQ